MSAPYLVVGAGPTGLGCAAALAADAPVIVVDRIPVAGGTAGWDHPTIKRIVRDLAKIDVRLRLGQTALRWTDCRLLLAGPGQLDQVAGRHLFVAAGLRPATVANLRIDGDRPAGVIPATVAEHLLQAGVRLWETAAIIGDGPWAASVARACRALGGEVIGVGPLDCERASCGHGHGRHDWADQRHRQFDQITVVGRDRVTALRLWRGGAAQDVVCDAVILAADPQPNRNINGALLDGDPAVTFVQGAAPRIPEDRYRAGHDAARAWLDAHGGDHR